MSERARRSRADAADFSCTTRLNRSSPRLCATTASWFGEGIRCESYRGWRPKVPSNSVLKREERAVLKVRTAFAFALGEHGDGLANLTSAARCSAWAGEISGAFQTAKSASNGCGQVHPAFAWGRWRAVFTGGTAALMAVGIFPFPRDAIPTAARGPRRQVRDKPSPPL